MIFFTPGRFKADIQCVSHQQQQQGSRKLAQFAGDGSYKPDVIDDQVWRFIPPLDITVTE